MEKLVQQILSYLSSTKRPRNWVLKLISLFLALFLWYFVVGEDKVEMNVSVPVEIVNLPRNLVISNQYRKQLDVMVSGQRSLIKGIADQHISRTVDLANAKTGKVIVNNTPDSISLPWGINVLRVQPDNLTLLLDKLVHKDLEIRPRISGTLDNGYKLRSVELEPPMINITGPESILAGEDFVYTRNINISNLKQKTSKEITLDLKPAIADLLGETVVTVLIRVSEITKEVEIIDLPVRVHDGKRRDYSLSPATVSFKANIPVDLAAETADPRKLFVAVVHPEKLVKGGNALQVEIKAADRALEKEDAIEIISVSPETIVVEISEDRALKQKP